jgi:hypothetical protein
VGSTPARPAEASGDSPAPARAAQSGGPGAGKNPRRAAADATREAAAAGDAAAIAAGAASATADPVATGAQAAEGSSRALPFSGSDVGLLAALGLLALMAGVALRTTGRGPTRDGA